MARIIFSICFIFLIYGRSVHSILYTVSFLTKGLISASFAFQCWRSVLPSIIILYYLRNKKSYPQVVRIGGVGPPPNRSKRPMLP
jgi:hypothetical protein